MFQNLFNKFQNGRLRLGCVLGTRPLERRYMYSAPRKILAITIFSAFILGCASSQKKPEVSDNGVLPKTCDAAIKEIASELDDESIATLRKTKKKDLIQFHFSWGMGIRNGLKLWEESSPIRISCAEGLGLKDMHPDNASGVIMDGVWEIINEKNI